MVFLGDLEKDPVSLSAVATLFVATKSKTERRLDVSCQAVVEDRNGFVTPGNDLQC